jgi:hypothetical protein
VTKDAEQEFLRLVVPGSTTVCWLWAGQHDQNLRPIFRGEKAYRVMYELRVNYVPDGFHVHHKCENSGCVNPRHLVALSLEDHRAVHATKNKATKEQIYRGEWQKIQAAKAEAERLERERLERQRIQREEKRIQAERQRLEEQESFRRTEQRKKQFDELFGTLRNGYKLKEQAAKSDEAWGLRKTAFFSSRPASVPALVAI